jgi:hypothetical protein
VIRSPAARLTYLNAPTQTGFVANLSPSASSCLGDRIIPARSASWAVSGEKRSLSCSRTVFALTTSTDATGASSLARAEPVRVRCRSSETLTACALNAVPSLKRTPVRRRIVIVFLSADRVGSDAASCGTISSFAFRS